MLLIIIFITLFLTGILTGPVEDIKVIKALEELPHVVSVEKLEANSLFRGKYLLTFEQAIDHDHPELGNFYQRVFVLHKSFKSPVVFTSEGFSANASESVKYLNEISSILLSNEIVVEHRYFSKSTPDTIQWKYLNTKNATADLHEIYLSLRNLYSEKWLVTGNDKGAITALFYQMQYPNDMATVVAFAPAFTHSLEDERPQKFVNSIASIKERKKILEFQSEMLKRRESLFPVFVDFVNLMKLNFRVPLEEIYDYCVLEFPFSFWKWIAEPEKIPDKKAEDSEIIDFFFQVVAIANFSIEASQIAANYSYANELGYYAYDMQNFNTKKEKLLTIDSTKNYFKKLFIPENINTNFSDTSMLKLENFIKTKAENTFLIYGEYDPAISTIPDLEENKNVFKIINPNANCLNTKIILLPKETQMAVIKQIQEIMYQN